MQKEKIVVKVGSAVLTKGGKISAERIQNLVEFLADIAKKYKVILVTSGAIATGHTILPVISNKTTAGKHPNAADDNGAKHHKSTSTKNSVRKGGQDNSKSREKASKDHDQGAAGNGLTINNMGHGDKTDILAEGCDRHAAENRPRRAGRAVY